MTVTTAQDRRRGLFRFGATRLLVSSMLVAATYACAAPRGADAPSQTIAEATVPRKPDGPMRPLVPTKMGPRLAEIGLDPKDLPPIEQLDPATKRKLMKSFSDALGVPCIGCHASGDLRADTSRKRVAKRMYNEMVRSLTLESGEPIFCDSCHQGSMYFLDRRDKTKLAEFMSDVLVEKLKRVDGHDHTCDTCHGDPPDFKFLTAWRSEPAPDLERAVAPAPAPTPEAAKPVSPPPTAVSRAVPPVPRKTPRAATKAADDCGDKTNLCPLQIWMRKNVSSAVAANDAAALARALDRVATFSPDASWTWAEMSKTAADAARRGDMREARKSCQGCHNAYKAAWRERYRARPIR